MNYLFLNSNFALKLQGKYWKDGGNVNSTSERNYQTFNKITRYEQKVVLAAMFEGKSMPSNMTANTNDTTLLKYLP